jgi:hypothetical protein
MSFPLEIMSLPRIILSACRERATLGVEMFQLILVFGCTNVFMHWDGRYRRIHILGRLECFQGFAYLAAATSCEFGTGVPMCGYIFSRLDKFFPAFYDSIWLQRRVSHLRRITPAYPHAGIDLSPVFPDMFVDVIPMKGKCFSVEL